ncbi:MAG: CRTAC1 family protein [Bacteroidota bacterium]
MPTPVCSRFARVRRASVLIFTLLVLAGCGGGESTERGIEANTDGTAAMVAALAAVVDSADANPSPYFHRNRRRAEALRARLLRVAGPQAFSLRYAFAEEVLDAGDSRAAIVETEDLLRQAGLRPEQIGTDAMPSDPRAPGALSPRTKPLVDLLALSHLRLAEQENCLTNHNGAVCILPFAREAEHTDETHARTAIRLYTALARRFPDDFGSRYLLNLAYVAVGEYPGGVPADLRVPGLARPTTAALPRFENVAPKLGLDVNGLSGGVSVADFDGDGHLDLFMSAYGLDENVRLFLADGTGGYRDHTQAAGLDGLVSGLNTTHADIDNDGDTDVLVLRGAWLGAVGTHPNSLLRNNGDGTFEDVTTAAGLGSPAFGAGHPTQVAAWADVDCDGNLDLFVGHESMGSYADLGVGDAAAGQRHPSHLYLNDGTGVFTERAADLGLTVDAFVKGAAFGDANGDGWPDLYVSVLGGANLLFLNREGTRFEEVAAQAGVQAPAFSFPTWWWDYDHDGDDDLFVISYDARFFRDVAGQVAREFLGEASQAERPRLYRNDGADEAGLPTFTDVTAEAGLDRVVFGMGSSFGDLNGDGWLDAYIGTGAPDLRSLVPNRMFLGGSTGTFEEVTMDGGFGHLQKGHGVAFADLDRDGDEDVYAVMGGAVEGDVFPNALFENPGFGQAHVTLMLEGDPAPDEGQGSNRSAIGARLRLTVADARGTERTLTRTVSTGGSFGANALQQTIGLGDAARIVALEVTWPDAAGTVQAYDALDLDASYRLVQGQPAERLDRPPVPFRHDATMEHGGHSM